MIDRFHLSMFANAMGGNMRVGGLSRVDRDAGGARRGVFGAGNPVVSTRAGPKHAGGSEGGG